MHADWLQQQQIPTQWWCKWISLKTSPVFVRMEFPVPIGNSATLYTVISGSRTKVYQWSFCQITSIMTRQWWYLTLHMFSTASDLGMHILWQDISALPGTMHIHQVEQIDKGKVSTCTFYSDWSCTIHSLNSVELAVINKHQDTNVNIGDFVVVKYEGKFYPGEVLYLVLNQSATVTQSNIVVWSSGNGSQNKMF